MTVGFSPLDPQGLRKARGAFFTPQPLARYVTDWAIRSPQDLVLEPSCGEAAFLLAAVDRLATWGGEEPASGSRLHGVEVHEDSARAARQLLQQAGANARVTVGDFFTVEPTASYDAVVGNPPYVRYQDFNGNERALARSAALRAGVRISNLASSWAAFTVHASLFLKPAGRLGLVLPGELLSVNYAAEVRSFLMRRFSRVQIVVFTERIFPGVQEEVVLLLAEGEGPTDHCELVQVRDVDELTSRETHTASRWTPRDTADKWTDALAPKRAMLALREMSNRAFADLETWGDTTLGMVTGANRYFALPGQRIHELGLPDGETIRLSPPGSRHLRALTFSNDDWESLQRAGKATHLFRPPGDPSRAAQAYIAAGEAGRVHEAYKCTVRTPWWRVPQLPVADLFLTYMNSDTPRLCTNAARVHHLNSVHGLYVRPGLKRLSTDLLPLAALNSATALSAELVGRSYGGGMLKLEPKEADRLLVPSAATLHQMAPALRAIKNDVREALRLGVTAAAVDLVDKVLLMGGCGLSPAQAKHLRDGVAELRGRRDARGASPRSIAP